MIVGPTRLAMLTALAVFGTCAMAQPVPYPNKPVRVVVSAASGTMTDMVARALATSLGTALGQPVVVDNKPGAEGMIAAESVAKSAPDGYTLLLASSSVLAANQFLKKKVPYAQTDFSPIGKVGVYTFVLSVHTGVPATTVQELLAYGQSNPNKLAYVTGDVTSIVTMSQLAAMGKVTMVRVPYKGSSLAMPDLLSGRVQLMIAPVGLIAPHVKDGKLRALSVLGLRRSSAFPDVPTFAEAGLPPFSVTPSAGLFGPANMQKEVIARLNREVNAILLRPEMREQFERQGFELDTSTPEELGNFMRNQQDAWGRAVREAGITPE